VSEGISRRTWYARKAKIALIRPLSPSVNSRPESVQKEPAGRKEGEQEGMAGVEVVTCLPAGNRGGLPATLEESHSAHVIDLASFRAGGVTEAGYRILAPAELVARLGVSRESAVIAFRPAQDHPAILAAA
jgi:hypothetical protein